MANLFTLEAFFAKHGDALLLHYGPFERPRMILIDGGPGGVFTRFVEPRIEQLREELDIADDRPFPLEMVMVSHIDDDHVNGVLRLFSEMEKAKDKKRPSPYAVKTLWHNSFDDLLGNAKREIVSRMAATAADAAGPKLRLPNMSEESRAVVASTRQGRILRNAAKKLKVVVNRPFQGLVMAPARKKVSLGHGLSFTLIGPLKDQVVEFQKRWDADLKKIKKKEKDSAKSSAFADDSPFNLASICVLARCKRKTMLLTGDARGDHVMEGLEKARLLKKTRPFHVDVLKVPHHGSDRNVEQRFFERVTADHYVFSGDGGHGNPERATLEMLERARGRAKYTVHFTVTKNQHRTDKSKKRKKALGELMAWVRQKPANCTVVFREAKSDVFSLTVDLLDPLNP